MTPREFVEYVDAFLLAEKRLVGLGQALSWGPGRDDGCQRVKLPIEIGGEQRGESLIVDAFPDANLPSFHILIEVGTAVCRVDHEASKIHPNSISGQFSGLPALVRGPHYHSWIDNRHLFTTFNQPVRLALARPLAPNLRQFDATFRWFCAQNSIVLDGQLGVELPPRGRII